MSKQQFCQEEVDSLQQQIEFLQSVDFSQGSKARQRVRLRLQQHQAQRSWLVLGGERLWLTLTSPFPARLTVALTALLLFAGLNARGIFSLPQHATFVAPIPFATAMMHWVDYTELRITKPETVQPDGVAAKTTPQLLPVVTFGMPTPMPVPVPLINNTKIEN